METNTVEAAMNQIAHTTDGPVDAFVLIVRAMRAVQSGTDPEVMANAVWDSLYERNLLTEGK